MIWFEIVLKLVGNELDCLGKFVGSLSNISLNIIKVLGIIG